ncbi:13465_t:CDS:1 [Funneliformis geosporum]|uniref:13181_t:CDS:1 n=1 Tax=Funneliformis geosporum TaxID=1117311 RepID=A0A9W4WND3_9GLOM|nr:13465_t:CDS:1 [Funneliformis geosporum]CAI2174788.1 13181_t:CDS:1 [Funneliformis geosporum]
MYQNPTENYERHENFGRDTFFNVNASYDGFSTTKDNKLNNHPVPYTAASMPTSNDEQYYYSTTTFETDSTTCTPQFIGHNSNDQQNPPLEQNPPSIFPPHNNPPINSPIMTNASSSQIQTVEILGYEIIIIPTPSPLANLTSLDMQNQLQRGITHLDYSSYSVNPPQLNHYNFATNGFDPTLQYLSHQPQSNSNDQIYLPSSPQIQSIQIPGYKIIIAPTSSPSSNLDMQHQFQQENTYLDYSFNSVNPPQLIQDQNHFSSAGEISIRPNVINFVQDNTQPQHQQQNNLGLNESLNDFNNFFG